MDIIPSQSPPKYLPFRLYHVTHLVCSDLEKIALHWKRALCKIISDSTYALRRFHSSLCIRSVSDRTQSEFGVTSDLRSGCLYIFKWMPLTPDPDLSQSELCCAVTIFAHNFKRKLIRYSLYS